MKTAAVIALTVVATVATAGLGYSAWRAMGTDNGPQFAEVVKVEPILNRIETPRQQCQDVVVERQVEPTDKMRATGTVIGAVVGGVVGHQFGGGSGKDVATAGGAIAGGYAGNRIQENMQRNNTVSTTEQRCTTVMDTRSETVGYKVTYRLGEEQGTVEMKEQPGDRLRVEDGRVVTD